jgi:hypothetical protein
MREPAGIPATCGDAPPARESLLLDLQPYCISCGSGDSTTKLDLPSRPLESDQPRRPTTSLAARVKRLTTTADDGGPYPARGRRP